MEKLQKGLDFLLKKYSVETQAVLKDNKTAIINHMELPILAHRSERRFIELKNIVNGGTLVGVSAMRVTRIIEKGGDLYEALYRELDLCQYILQRTIKSVMTMQNDNVLNAIVTTEDGVVCTIEMAATLSKEETPKDKHEIISQRGIASDIVVDAQLQQDSIYVFGKENQQYTDVDYELYGYLPEEIAIIRAAFELAKNKNYDDMTETDEKLHVLVAMAKTSAKTGERMELSI